MEVVGIDLSTRADKKFKKAARWRGKVRKMGLFRSMAGVGGLSFQIFNLKRGVRPPRERH